MPRTWKVILEGVVEGIEAQTPLEAVSKLFEAFALSMEDDGHHPTWNGYDAMTFAVLPVWGADDLQQCKVPMCHQMEESPGVGLCDYHLACPFCGVPYDGEPDKDAPPSYHPCGLNLLPYVHHIDVNGNEVIDTEVYCDRCGRRYAKRFGTDLVKDAIAYFERILPPPSRPYGVVLEDALAGEEVKLGYLGNDVSGTMYTPGAVAGEDLKAGQVVRRRSHVSYDVVAVATEERNDNGRDLSLE